MAPRDYQPFGIWNAEGWPTAAEWGAFWTFATFMVALGAAVAAFSQLRVILEDREERERPYLSVDFEFRSLLVLISVTNISPKLATSVRLTSTPLPPTTRDDRLGKLDRVFSGNFVIPQMAPGRRISWHLDSAPSLFGDDAQPRRFEVTATYVDPLARRVGWFGFRSSRPEPRQYEDTFVLDLDQYGQAATEQDYDNKNWNIAQRNERQIKRIADSVENLFKVSREELEAKRDLGERPESSDASGARDRMFRGMGRAPGRLRRKGGR